MSSIRQCANIKGALLKYNNMIVRSKIKLKTVFKIVRSKITFTTKYLKYHFKVIIRQPSICCIIGSLPLFLKLF